MRWQGDIAKKDFFGVDDPMDDHDFRFFIPSGGNFPPGTAGRSEC